jgi:hypothetical protein
MYSSQGLIGHLSNGHGLGGKELRRKYREAVPPGGGEREGRIEKFGDDSDEPPVMRAIQRVAKWRDVLRAVQDESFRESFLDADIFGDEKAKAHEELREEVKDRLDQAREDYKEAIAQRAERDE